MIQSPQTIRLSRDDERREAVVAWRYEGDGGYVVEISSSAFDTVAARADDAFEALCLVRERLEPDGWRIGVAGAQADVWPSGMARDQGGGRVAYRMSEDGVGGTVDTFQPVDPAQVVTVAEQRIHVDRLFAAAAHGAREDAAPRKWYHALKRRHR